MRIIKAKIEVSHANGGTEYIGYPDVWLSNKEKLPEFLYPRDRSDEIVENGKTYQTVFLCAPNDIADTMLKDGTFAETTEAEVRAYANKHAPERSFISDMDKVISVLEKVKDSTALTAEDMAAIDPNSASPGIEKTPNWMDAVFTKYGVTF